MDENILTVTVSSPQELQTKISEAFKKGGFEYRFIAISFNDMKVCVYPFHLTNIAEEDLKDQLIEEALQLTPLREDDIELDFQIFGRKNGVLEGVFICMPKKLLEQYVDICDKARLIPIHFSAHLLTCIGDLFNRHKKDKDRFCILDFAKNNCVHMAIFCNNKCEFLRRIEFESRDEAHNDIIQSLRSASAKSEIKTIDQIYIGGKTENYRQLINELKSATDAQIEEERCPADETEKKAAFDFRNNYFTVNLTRHYSFALPRRKQFKLISNVVLAVLLIIPLMGAVKFVNLQMKINQIKSSFAKKDLKRAQDLESRINELSNKK